jgi:hypothetical protein
LWYNGEKEKKSIEGRTMKKYIMMALLTSNMFASCLQSSSNDAAAVSMSSNCLNAFDMPSIDSPISSFLNPTSISTKIAGVSFNLRIKNSCMNSKNVTYSLIDLDDSNKTIATASSVNPFSNMMGGYSLNFNYVTFNVPEIYKNVKVKFEYETYDNFKLHKVSCPTMFNWTKWTKVTTISSPESLGVGFFAVPKMVGFMPTFECYEIKADKVTHTEYSTDNFAIRPDRFIVSLDKSSVFRGVNVGLRVSDVNKLDNIMTMYAKNGVDFDVTSNKPNVKIHYSFDIVDGKSVPSSKIYFTNAGEDVNVNIKERVGGEWAVIDLDDTKDECRLVSGTSNNIRVLETTRNWAGTGTGESENDPMKRNLKTNIRENVDRDLHFQKINW